MPCQPNVPGLLDYKSVSDIYAKKKNYNLFNVMF